MREKGEWGEEEEEENGGLHMSTLQAESPSEQQGPGQSRLGKGLRIVIAALLPSTILLCLHDVWALETQGRFQTSLCLSQVRGLQVGRPWRWGDLGWGDLGGGDLGGGGTLEVGDLGGGDLGGELGRGAPERAVALAPPPASAPPGGPVLGCYGYLRPHDQASPFRQEPGKCVPLLPRETQSSPEAAPHSSPFTWTERGGTATLGRGRMQKREGRALGDKARLSGKSRIPAEERGGDPGSPHGTRESWL